MPWLQWHQRDENLKATAKTPYRLLQPVRSLSHGDGDAPNMLIQGDNLEALKALLPYYAGQVKCIFIDPPYNTKSAFEHYDDNLEHAQWLSMMYPRMVLLRELLAEDGSIWITLDDNEAHYFKVMCDEVFGRRNFAGNVVWQKKFAAQANSVGLSAIHDHILVYAKNADGWQPNLLPRTAEADARYSNQDNDPRGPWMSDNFTISLTGGARGAQFARTGSSPNVFEITTPSGRRLYPTPGRCWGTSHDRFQELVADNRIWFGTNGGNVPRLKRFLAEVQGGLVPPTWWTREEVGDNLEAKREVSVFNSEEIFATPKPERLMARILSIASSPGDLILDSFLGSGTTAAVAHKMGRRWIGIEMGEHARTHCQPRLVKVVDGEQGGISAAVGWQGGGGFRFYQLGPKVFDDQGRINPEIKFEHLAAHLWFAETGTARSTRAMKSPLLGVHNGTAYYLLYNGILGDHSLSGGNMLTMKLLASLPKHDGPKVIYGEGTNMTNDRLRSLGIKFKKTPNDIRAR